MQTPVTVSSAWAQLNRGTIEVSHHSSREEFETTITMQRCQSKTANGTGRIVTSNVKISSFTYLLNVGIVSYQVLASFPLPPLRRKSGIKDPVVRHISYSRSELISTPLPHVLRSVCGFSGGGYHGRQCRACGECQQPVWKEVMLAGGNKGGSKST